MFDIDETLTDSYKYDEECFLLALNDVFGLADINKNLDSYKYITDTGLIFEIVKRYLGRNTSIDEMMEMGSKFLYYMEKWFMGNKEDFVEIPGTTRLLNMLKEKEDISISVATGGWEKAANFKLKKTGLDLCM